MSVASQLLEIPSVTELYFWSGILWHVFVFISTVTKQYLSVLIMFCTHIYQKTSINTIILGNAQ